MDEGQIERIKMQVYCLRQQSHSYYIACTIVDVIKSTVETGQVSWQDIECTERELEQILEEKFSKAEEKDSSAEIIQGFIRAWVQYQQNEITLQEFKRYFKGIDRLLGQFKIKASDLEPFSPNDFFEIKDKIDKMENDESKNCNDQ